jgi:hypothetical protein
VQPILLYFVVGLNTSFLLFLIYFSLSLSPLPSPLFLSFPFTYYLSIYTYIHLITRFYLRRFIANFLSVSPSVSVAKTVSVSVATPSLRQCLCPISDTEGEWDKDRERARHRQWRFEYVRVSLSDTEWPGAYDKFYVLMPTTKLLIYIISGRSQSYDNFMVRFNPHPNPHPIRGLSLHSIPYDVLFILNNIRYNKEWVIRVK